MEFLLYNFYYRTLPALFFERNDYWLKTDDPNALFEDLLVLWEDEVYDVGDPEQDLYVHRLIREKIKVETIGDYGFLLLLELEKPIEATLPLYLALVEVNFERYYFTYELQANSYGEEKEEFVFGSWKEDTTHSNYGIHSNLTPEYFVGLVKTELKIS